MIFSKLVGLRYCLYFFGSTISLATLYTFVDVLEKFTRYPNASFAVIAQYAGIALIPNFIALSPIGCLLGSILLLREWSMHNQFLTMFIHGISRIRFAGTLFTYSLFTTSIVFTLHETIGYKYARQMAQAKTLLFNRIPQQAAWLRANATTFILGLGHRQYYVLQTGGKPSIAVIRTSAANQDIASQIVNFQSETLGQKYNFNLNKSTVSILTYSSTEESFLQALCQNSTKHGQRVMSDLCFFFLKILFMPFFVAACFLLANQRPYMRWLYAGLPYIALSTSHTCAQLLGPLQGIALFSTMVLLLMAFISFKIS